MDKEQVRRLVERQAHAWETQDTDTIVADFAPGGVFISPSGRWQGQNAIRDGAESFFKDAQEIRCTVQRVLLDGGEGAVELTWSETSRTTGKRSSTEDAVIFQLNGDKIDYWREYIAKKEGE